MRKTTLALILAAFAMAAVLAGCDVGCLMSVCP
jgi:hypothetical protein